MIIIFSAALLMLGFPPAFSAQYEIRRNVACFNGQQTEWYFRYDLDDPNHGDCTQWCDGRSSCVGFSVFNGQCFFKNDQCPYDLRSHAGTDLWLKKGVILKNEANVDCLYGKNIHHLTADGSSYPRDCVEWCRGNETCGGFALWYNNCYFKGVTCPSNIIQLTGAVLFLKPFTGDEYERRDFGDCLIFNDLDSLTSDGTFGNNNCMSWCNNHPDCTGFSVYRGTCFFKGRDCKDDLTDNPNTVLFLKSSLN